MEKSSKHTERKKSQPKIDLVQKLPSSEEQFRKLYETFLPIRNSFMLHLLKLKKKERVASIMKKI
jgi:hypothetical protein